MSLACVDQCVCERARYLAPVAGACVTGHPLDSAGRSGARPLAFFTSEGPGLRVEENQPVSSGVAVVVVVVMVMVVVVAATEGVTC